MKKTAHNHNPLFVCVGMVDQKDLQRTFPEKPKVISIKKILRKETTSL